MWKAKVSFINVESKTFIHHKLKAHWEEIIIVGAGMDLSVLECSLIVVSCG